MTSFLQQGCTNWGYIISTNNVTYWDKVLKFMNQLSIFLFQTTAYYPWSQLPYGHLMRQNPLAQLQNYSVLNCLNSLPKFKVTSKSQGKLLISTPLQKMHKHSISMLWPRIYIANLHTIPKMRNGAVVRTDWIKTGLKPSGAKNNAYSSAFSISDFQFQGLECLSF